MAKDRTHRAKRPNDTRYGALDFALLRAPLLPVESFTSISEELRAPAGSPTLAPIDPEIRRALSIGSPTLLDAPDRTAPDDEKAETLKSKLRRFLVRMSTRPTPYGTFAGTALSGWGGRTDVSLDGTTRTRTRPDMDWLVRYVLALDKQPAVRAELRWIANSVVWIHYDRAIKGTSGVSIAATPVVRKVLDFALTPIPYNALVERLMASALSATAEKVERLLKQMWELGFLRTDLMPPVTTEDPLGWVRERVAPIMGGKALCVQLDALVRTVAACDTVTVSETPKALKRAIAHLEMLGQTEITMPLQVDMALGLGGNNIASLVATEAARTAELLFELGPKRGNSSILGGYRQAFLARYGPDREVPLPELLHPEWGLGPLEQHSGGKVDWGQTGQRAETLQYLALRAIREGQTVVELDDVLIDKLKTSTLSEKHLPASIDLNLFILAKSRAAIDTGDFQLLVGANVGATAAGSNLGRFAALLGPRGRMALECSARREEEYHTGAVVAELAFMPSRYRSANVTVRPAVRRYEITHGVSASVDTSCVIPLNQLVVGLRNGRFYVRWPAGGMDVHVASGHMLNISQSPEEYQFLTHICQDGMMQLSWFDWGPANGFTFLPRVQSGRSILSCAQWRLDLSGRHEAPINAAKPFAEWLARWRTRWLVPRYVYLSWTDNRLLYDLDDPAQVEDLRGEVGLGDAQGNCLLQEALPALEHGWLPSANGGHHVVELVVSLGLNHVPSKPAAGPVGQRIKPRVTQEFRLRPPGSDWLYLKLYGPRSGEDEFLAGPLARLCHEINDSGAADQWFFVRYADPERHVRLRFHAPEGNVESLFSKLCAWASGLVAGGRCDKFAFDTYEREVERYGGPEGMQAAEALFAIDSRGVVDLLGLAARVDRVTLAVLTIDDLLCSLGLETDSARLAWLKQTVDSRKEVGEEYRKKRDRLIDALCGAGELDPPVQEVLARRRSALCQVGARLAALEEEGVLTQPKALLFESYAHMHCNRISADQAIERRALGLLLRACEAIAHHPMFGARAQSMKARV
jgi:thiopeptide-type bacteriocin biosynthesis protein